MPFIKPERRAVIDLEGCDKLWKNTTKEVGDLCYIFYKEMVGRWRKNPRWTTAHEIYKDVVMKRWQMAFVDRFSDDQIDAIIAFELAWQVFFVKYVMRYEEQKIVENGDI